MRITEHLFDQWAWIVDMKSTSYPTRYSQILVVCGLWSTLSDDWIRTS
jgi:hypothetical protein